jgi:hypothetical protein
MSWIRVLAVALTCAALTACGNTRATSPAAEGTPRAAHPLAHWTAFAHLATPLDVVGPRRDGSLVLAASGRLWTLGRSGTVRRYAPAYKSPGGEEPYIALSPGGCFGRGTAYAIRLSHGRGLTAITSDGKVRRLASIAAPGLIDGITFGFGGRLLVTVEAGAHTTIETVDCRGRVRAVTRHAPRMEGGIAVAPLSFGRFAGDLIGSDEQTGLIWAVTPAGKSALVARSGLSHGGDIGVESEGFVPAGAGWDALLADRRTPGNPHPGDDVVLRLPMASLGVGAGDLLIATEGGALTDAVRCRRAGCSVREVATGPAIAHAEGHIAFARWR